jgi:hypothetical protein
MPHSRIGLKGGRIRITESDLEEYLQKTKAVPVRPLIAPSRPRNLVCRNDGFDLLWTAGWRG